MITANKPNRLINEKSPYLLQHAYNPVDWYPWGEEAFNKAKEEHKPIFLSIGYSTCHWCHVMERESFEDKKVAEILNNKYIPIKVDREERPDIDSVYMKVCQMLTGAGGWPMTIIMTPDKKPFFAGTYFPKKTQYGRNGLIDILLTISSKWKTDKDTIVETGEYITQSAQKESESIYEEAEMTFEYFHKSKDIFKRNFDTKHGSFGNAPKFPTPHNLLFLMRYSVFEKDDSSMQMVEKTLNEMYKGGIFDHIAGGFSRYSTDNKWLVPHFEKMLYDNALLIIAYLEAYQITGEKLYKDVVEKTIQYIAREMTDTNGGYYAAQDADSEGIEGKYYVFTPKELISVLGEEDGKLFNHSYDITVAGNFEENNVPNLINNKDYSMYIDTETSIGKKFNLIFNKLYEYRKRRTTLILDDKILTSWNALMISAISQAYLVLGKNEYLMLAENAANFLCNKLTDEKGNLFVHYREGTLTGKGYIDDYAYTTLAMINMYKATFNVKWLSKALMYAKNMVEKFYDFENSGFYLYSEQSEQLFIRPKETYDGALPSGNSVASYVLAYIAKITAEHYWEELSYKQTCFLAEFSKSYPAGYSFAMIAGMLNIYPTTEIVAVIPNAEYIKDIVKIFSDKNLFNTVCIIKTEENKDEIEKIAPYTKDYDAKNGHSTYYVCRNKTCAAPVFTIEELVRLI